MASVEGIVNLVPATLDVVKQAQSLRAEIIAKFGRWQWFILSVESLQKGEGWAEYVGRINDLQKALPSRRSSWCRVCGAMSRAFWRADCVTAL